MNNIRLYIVFIAFACLIISPGINAEDIFNYDSTVDSLIPGEGNPGIWDTIQVTDDVIIHDLDVYVGIETIGYSAGALIITLTSPWQDTVTICHRNINRVLPLWFDTEDDEDGPGDLDDYIGFNAIGSWVMYVYTFADIIPLTWDNWAIEIVGDQVGIHDEPSLPLATGLNNIYPNPFNSHTVFHYSLESAGTVYFNIYNVLGELVRKFDVEHATPGQYQLKWDGCNADGETVASGIYYARMTAIIGDDSQTFTKKMTLLK